ncbi:Glandicoline B O-methyltransferase roqN [Colletotrichum spinosum]|uniref:Glandicoline B O-methyltransferase roqN n=1 Tax=Colletotrichum spinosum TaxID=1347390 RepID=A0A4R8Q890_9PEZI|nr:Glandicoline B O-methyltransferase roqN [Colletotrichum spinosum]
MTSIIASKLSSPAPQSDRTQGSSGPNFATPSLNASGDRANLTTLWREPEVGAMYRNTEYTTAKQSPTLIDYCGLTEDVLASLTRPIRVLDMCCGAGVVAAHLQARMKKLGIERKNLVQLTCADSSTSQLEHVSARVKDQGWTDTKVVVADIACLPFDSNSFDHVLVGNALMVVAEPYAGLSEIFRVLKPGGRIATSTWAVEGWVDATRDAVAELRLPGSQQPVPWPQTSYHLTRSWSPGLWEDEYFTAAMYNAAGFTTISTKTEGTSHTFNDGQQLHTAFETLQLGIIYRFWTAEQREKLAPLLAPTISEHIRKKYGGEPFEVTRTSVFATGMKPEA